MKILCQVQLELGSILNDKFLVQLAKTTPQSGELSTDAVTKLWGDVKKEKMVQYRMRVDIAGQG